MKDRQDYEQDLKQIRSLMDKSTRFVSLSGSSGILIGFYALIGAFITYKFIYQESYYLDEKIIVLDIRTILKILVVACSVILGSLLTVFLLSARKAKQNNQSLFGKSALMMMGHFMTPLITGGCVCLLLLWTRGNLGVLDSLTLIFYGLGLISASKYTHKDIFYLGACQIALGLTSMLFPGYGLLFWSIGFGVLHIIYGIVLYIKYER